MKVAALQMVTSTRWDANRDQAWALLQQAAQAGAELAVLPEYFCLMGHKDTDKLALAEPLGHGPMQQFLADSARELGLMGAFYSMGLAVFQLAGGSMGDI